MEIDHEIISLVILLFPLIQEGQLSGTGKGMCTLTLDNCLGDLSLSRNSVTRLTDSSPYVPSYLKKLKKDGSVKMLRSVERRLKTE